MNDWRDLLGEAADVLSDEKDLLDQADPKRGYFEDLIKRITVALNG